MASSETLWLQLLHGFMMPPILASGRLQIQELARLQVTPSEHGREPSEVRIGSDPLTPVFDPQGGVRCVRNPFAAHSVHQARFAEDRPMSGTGPQDGTPGLFGQRIEKGFWIDQFPVTHQEFCRFLNEKGNQKEGGAEWYDLKYSRIERAKGGSFRVKKGCERHPVVGVT